MSDPLAPETLARRIDPNQEIGGKYEFEIKVSSFGLSMATPHPEVSSTSRGHMIPFMAWQRSAFLYGVSSVALIVAGCSSVSKENATDNATDASDPKGASGPSSALCPPCLVDSDCSGGGVCAQFQGDIYCAPACPNGDECATNRTCTHVSTAGGLQTDLCIPPRGTCGAEVDPAALQPDAKKRDAGTCGPVDRCGSLVGPSTPSSCVGCGAHPCQPNGCYAGWWCDTATSRCQMPPASCGDGCDGGVGHDAGAWRDGGAAGDSGGAGGGSVGENGGTASSLHFAIVGDTRPPVINDTSGYPTAIISQIYDGIASLSPMPTWAVSTGDYIFSSANGGASAQQFPIYQAARARYSGMLFPAMGNHECTGAVTSNCGPGTTNGNTANYANFMSAMLAPIHKTSPNYVIAINAPDRSWTSKFVFVAGNSWTSADATWLDSALAVPTTYTFIVRHEPRAASTAPGCAASERIMANHPYTLAIVGHTHTYAKTGPKQVTIGNGGAPLTGGATYGFGIVSQRSDRAIQVDMVNYQTGQPDLNFRFALNPDGTVAP